MAKRKKKHVTYDSQETKVFFGLICMLLSVFFGIALVTSPIDRNVFAQARSIFGDSSFLPSVFFFLLGLRILGVHFTLNKTKNLIALGLLCLWIPTFLTSVSIGNQEIFTSCNILTENTNCQINCKPDITGNLAGGAVGCIVIKDVVGDSIPVNAGTRLLSFILVVITLPVFFSIPLSSIAKAVQQINSFLSKVKDYKANDSKSEENDITQTASTFGDFNQLVNKKASAKDDKKSIEKKTEFSNSSDNSNEKHINKNNITVRELELNNNTLEQSNLKFPGWKLPPLSLLIPYQKANSKETTINQNANIIEKTLSSFGVTTKVVKSFVGPSVVMYALDISLGTKVEKIMNLSANLALALGVDSHAVRIESIPDTTYLGIEIPRVNRDMVRFKELMESSDMKQNNMFLPIPIGKNIDGSAIIYDIQKLPHLLIAGATGSGKSVLTNSFISSLLMHRSPDELRLILVDPKQVELIDYDGIPHLLTPVITEMEKVVNALKWLVGEMERRYSTLAAEKVRNIQSFNEKKGFAAMPFIVVVIDEMADMMMTANRAESEVAIVRLAQKARAVGIHLILATQRPSVNVITGIIKANIPGRVGMSVTSGTDSRVILDRIGSESLMGRGDLLFKAPDRTKPDRLQAANIEQEEISRIVDFIRSQAPEVEYITEIVEKSAYDEDVGVGSVSGSLKGSLLEQAIRVAVQYNKGSSSFLQRKLSIGFNKAAELVEQLEELGVVGPQVGQKPREVLIGDAEEFIQRMKSGDI